MKDDKPRPWIYGGLLAAAVAAVVLLPRHDAQPNLALNATAPFALAGAGLDSPTPRPSSLIIYVCGAVRKAGVYRLPADARAIDAVQRAGGTTADADLEQVNLADKLVDGARFMVPHKGQQVEAFSVGIASTGSSQARGHARHSRRGGSSSRHKLQPGQTLDVNTATEQELITLPGVGPGLARRIVEYRTANGPFQSVDDLQNVSGIGPSKFDKLSAYIRL